MAENAIKSGWLSYSHEGFETLLWQIIAWLHKGIRSNDSFFFFRGLLGLDALLFFLELDSGGSEGRVMTLRLMKICGLRIILG